MIKKLIVGVITWMISAVDIEIEKDGDVLTVTVELYNKPLFTKTIPIRRR